MPPVAVTEFQNALAELAAKSGEAADKLLRRITRLSPAEARAFITDAYPALLTPFLAASGELTAQWYSEQPAAERRAGSAVFTPTAAPLAPGEQLAISGRWALTQSNPVTAIRGNATRQVLDASRDTVVLNAQREGVRWIRQAKPDACGFCKMLATRAQLRFDRFAGRDMSYTSQGVRRKVGADGRLTKDYTVVVIGKRGNTRGKRARGSEYHDHCRCTAVPLRDGKYEPPEYVQRWTDQYISLFDEYGADGAAISRRMDSGRRTGAFQDGPDLLSTAAVAETAATAPAPTAAASAPDAPVDVPADSVEAGLADAVAPEKTGSALDRAIVNLNNAIEAGADDATIEKLAARAELLERKALARAERDAAKAAAAEAADMAKQSEILRLVEGGMDAAEAEADVYGVTVESIRRRDFIAKSRRDGHVGKGFDELVNSVYSRWIADEVFWKAEAETNGMIRSSYIGKFDPLRLWSVPEAQARKVMTEEMAAWFDANGGRVTRSMFRQAILDGRDFIDMSQQGDFLQ